ncbi:Tat pathway signal protein [Planktotalea sp.]|uniref:Tat pathway signal protein n=1 Tax=Planktotalea sp. TaxID=2029877 RepID=UPI0035C7DEF6
MKLTRRGFIASALAAGAVRSVPQIATKTGGRRILTLVYDKSLGMMRAVERVVP